MGYLNRLSRRGKNDVSESIHTVDSVREDGMVNLQVGPRPQDVLPGVAALSSYVDRRSGDRVTVRKGRGLWVVVGKAGKVTQGTPVTVAAGAAPPDGSGWTKAQTVWARGTEIYIQRDTVSQPDEPAPASVTVDPDEAGGWAEGHRNVGSPPRQGTYTGYGPWSGGWFYGTKIADACAGRSVASMTVRLVRSGSSHGYYSPQQPTIYVHGYRAAPSGALSLADPQSPSKGLGLGEGFDFTLTASQVASLAGGSAFGVGVFTAQYQSDYMIFSSSATVTIRFA